MEVPCRSVVSHRGFRRKPDRQRDRVRPRGHETCWTRQPRTRLRLESPAAETQRSQCRAGLSARLIAENRASATTPRQPGRHRHPRRERSGARLITDFLTPHLSHSALRRSPLGPCRVPSRREHGPPDGFFAIHAPGSSAPKDDDLISASREIDDKPIASADLGLQALRSPSSSASTTMSVRPAPVRCFDAADRPPSDLRRPFAHSRRTATFHVAAGCHPTNRPVSLISVGPSDVSSSRAVSSIGDHVPSPR